MRPRQARKVAGVCLGFAGILLDIDVTLLRVVWLITAFMTGFGFLAYIIGWIIMPEEPLLLLAVHGERAASNKSVAGRA